MALLGFVIVLLVDAVMLMLASEIAAGRDQRRRASAGRSLAALVASAVTVVIDVDRGHERRRHVHAARRPAHRQAAGRCDAGPTSRGCSSSRSTGSRCRCSGARCATATRRRWRRGSADGSHRLVEWEPDLSSQTGASQAGILLGSNQDIPAFRWVDKETARVIACSGPQTARRSSASARDRDRPAGQRRLEPRRTSSPARPRR